MMTIGELSARSGVSIRALRHYDKLGLLKPAQISPSGYRLYDDAALERLGHILLFKEIQFPLKEIQKILDKPDFDRQLALRQQIELLELRRERLGRLIELARKLQEEDHNVDFSAFDTQKMDSYTQQARQQWGDTPAYRAFEEKSKGRNPQQEKDLGEGLMVILAEFGRMQQLSLANPAVQAQVRKLQAYITDHYYPCTDPILRSLGLLYAAGGEMTDNIDRAGGPGTAAFAARAIEAMG